jgi:hypothetical protein
MSLWRLTPPTCNRAELKSGQPSSTRSNRYNKIGAQSAEVYASASPCAKLLLVLGNVGI